MIQGFSEATTRLAEVGRRFDTRGWVMGTGGNFSVVLTREPLCLAITPSGAWKGSLRPEELLKVGADGAVIDAPGKRSSAETLLHVEIARARGAGAVLHTHSVWGTTLSGLYAAGGGLAIEGYEMLKGLEGVTTHEHREWIPILENDQDMPRLARQVGELLRQDPALHGFLLRNHGLYTWGEDLMQATRHVEILEFLFEVEGHSAMLGQKAQAHARGDVRLLR